MRRFIFRLFHDSFVRHNVVFFAGSFIAAVLNYLFHPVLGRLMSIEDFGEVQALISIAAQAGIFVGVFGPVAMHIVVNDGIDTEKGALILRFQRLAFMISFSIFLLLVFFGGRLRSALQFSSIWPFFAVLLTLIMSIAALFRSAYLQGKHHFYEVSLSGIIWAGAKLMFATLFVLIGLRTLGAMIGLLLAQLLMWMYVAVKTKDIFPRSDTPVSASVTPRFKRELRYAAVLFVATLAVTFFYSTDVVFAKVWFSPVDAGLYSGIATIGRIIFFLTGSVTGVLFPMITLTNSHAVNRQLLHKAILVTGLLGASAWLAFFIAPALITKILIGTRYISAAPLLPLVGGLNLLAALLNTSVMYLMALKRYDIIPFLLAGIALVCVLSYVHHDVLQQLVLNFIIGCASILVGFVFYARFFRQRALSYDQSR